jgi:hypothetical protein
VPPSARSALRCNDMCGNEMRCNEMRCNEMRCNDVRCNDVRCNDVRCNDVRCNDVRCNDMWSAVTSQRTSWTELSRSWVHRVATDGRAVADLAAEIIELAGWAT